MLTQHVRGTHQSILQCCLLTCIQPTSVIKPVPRASARDKSTNEPFDDTRWEFQELIALLVLGCAADPGRSGAPSNEDSRHAGLVSQPPTRRFDSHTRYSLTALLQSGRLTKGSKASFMADVTQI